MSISARTPLDYARHLAAVATHKLRAERIGRQIADSHGRLPHIRTRLYPYQIEGTAFLAGTGRALLADDMGLGKTLQAIAAAVWLREHEEVRKVLIICPASLKQQWAREIEKFTGLASQIVQGPPPERGVQYRREAAFFIINYELVLRDLSVINETLRPDLIIMDEAQRIKNWRTKIASAVKLIPSRYAFVLTGTPLENRLEDLYSLMQVVDPKILGPLWRYMIDFHVTDERGKVLGYRNLSILRQRLAPVMLRRDRRLVRDQLPDRIVQRLDVAMTAKQVELHDSAMSSAGTLATIAKKRPLTPTEQNRLMAALQQARMACNAAGLVDKETEGSPKLDELATLLDELCVQSGLKAVVFSQWETDDKDGGRPAQEDGARLCPPARRGSHRQTGRADGPLSRGRQHPGLSLHRCRRRRPQSAERLGAGQSRCTMEPGGAGAAQRQGAPPRPDQKGADRHHGCRRFLRGACVFPGADQAASLRQRDRRGCHRGRSRSLEETAGNPDRGSDRRGNSSGRQTGNNGGSTRRPPRSLCPRKKKFRPSPEGKETPPWNRR